MNKIYTQRIRQKLSEEVFSKTSYDKLTRLLVESDTDFALVTEWFNVDKPELEKFQNDFPPVINTEVINEE